MESIRPDNHIISIYMGHDIATETVVHGRNHRSHRHMTSHGNVSCMLLLLLWNGAVLNDLTEWYLVLET